MKMAKWQVWMLSAILLWCISLTSFALQLGKMDVQSALGEPLRADIELIDEGSDGDLESLVAMVSVDAAYGYGEMLPLSVDATDAQEEKLLRTDGSFPISTRVVHHQNGKPLLRLSSTDPVLIRYLEFTVQVKHNNQMLKREYALLLDPWNVPSSNSNFVAAEVEQPMPPTPVTNVGHDLLDAKNTSDNEEETVITVETETGDSLSAIATALLPELDVKNITLEQLMVALFESNRDAFEQDNMNQLKANQTLTVPALGEVKDMQTAYDMVQLHASNWRAYSNQLAQLTKQMPTVQSPSVHHKHAKQITHAGISKSAKAVNVVKITATRNSQQAVGTQGYKVEEKTNEDALAHEKALNEEKSRVKVLEQQTADIKQLLELKARVATKHPFDVKRWLLAILVLAGLGVCIWWWRRQSRPAPVQAKFDFSTIDLNLDTPAPSDHVPTKPSSPPKRSRASKKS